MSNDEPMNLPDFESEGSSPVRKSSGENPKAAADLAPVFDVPVNIQAVLGRTMMEVQDLLRLGPGSVMELDRRVGEAIDIYVNNRLVARGEIVIVDDRLGVTMTEIIKDGEGVS